MTTNTGSRTTTDVHVARNCNTPMQKNICYSNSANYCSIARENREIVDGSYPYSYPYPSSMSLAVDTTGGSTNEEQALQANQGILNDNNINLATAATDGEMAASSGGNVIMKQRGCENEEDIYSYII